MICYAVNHVIAILCFCRLSGDIATDPICISDSDDDFVEAKNLKAEEEYVLSY